MSYDQLACSCLQSAAGSLESCGMMTGGCHLGKFIQIGGFMIENIHAMHPGRLFCKWCSVRAIGIGAWFVRQITELFKRQDNLCTISHVADNSIRAVMVRILANLIIIVCG